MRTLLIMTAAAMLANIAVASAETATGNNCKVCADQQKACMKNYAGPTCKSEYQMCMKSCKK